MGGATWKLLLTWREDHMITYPRHRYLGSDHILLLPHSAVRPRQTEPRSTSLSHLNDHLLDQRSHSPTKLSIVRSNWPQGVGILEHFSEVPELPMLQHKLHVAKGLHQGNYLFKTSEICFFGSGALKNYLKLQICSS